jgi:hypothetical protein
MKNRAARKRVHELLPRRTLDNTQLVLQFRRIPLRRGLREQSQSTTSPNSIRQSWKARTVLRIKSLIVSLTTRSATPSRTSCMLTFIVLWLTLDACVIHAR